MHRESGSRSLVPKMHMAERIVSMLDEDDDGLIGPNEWMDWLKEGQRTLLMDETKKQEFAAVGPENRCILDFLDMVRYKN